MDQLSRLRVGISTRATVLLAAALACGLGLPAQPAPSHTANSSLPAVLARLNHAARRIHTITADAVSSQYTAVVDDLSVKSGRLYFENTRHGPWLKLSFVKPAPETFIYRDGMGWIYQPRMRQVQKYNLKKHKAALRAFLLLGLGESGSSLRHSFVIQDLGRVMRAGQPRIWLNLAPRDAKVRGSVEHIQLWFDPRTWIAVRQKYFESRGDYRLLRLTNIKINPRLSGRTFQAYFPGARVITPHF